MTTEAQALTDLEFSTMNYYAHQEHNQGNGATPKQASDVYTYLWADEAASAVGISAKAMGGVLTSLTNKGFANVTKGDRRDPDGGFSFTEAGFVAWKAEFDAKGMTAR